MKSTAPKAFPKDFQRLQVLWSEIRRRMIDDGAHPDSTAWEECLSTGSWAWVADFRRVAPWDVDRTRDVLLGPLFSSLAHPWPEGDGSPMIPLAQFDLENASKVGGVDLGSGLLQLFCRQSDRLGRNIAVRVLEKSAIHAEALTAIPDFSNASALFASVAWATVLSYEVERRIVAQSGVSTDQSSMPNKLAPRLTFSRRADARLGGMTTLMLMFPSRALVKLVDPLKLRGDAGGNAVSFEQLQQHAVALLAPLIEPMVDRSIGHGPFDRRWYWVALARLERAQTPSSRAWCEHLWSDARQGSEDHVHDLDSAFHAHMEQWLQAWDGRIDALGRVPRDLLDVLATLALAGPATCALRSLSRHWPLSGDDDDAQLGCAVRMAEGLRSQFNAPRAVGLLKSLGDDDAYWEKVLQYGADGNLQAMLDEYVHVLVDSLNLARQKPAAALDKLARAMFDAMALRAAPLRPDEISVAHGRLQIKPFPHAIRTHFALRYGGKSDDDGAAARKETVQAGFNSPFWPFVLVSTSVGQEGLDFHTWCHSVIHWNLPANPVDMEQREGRVHRYKGHAVRKNVALQYGDAGLCGLPSSDRDPWARMFQRAVAQRAPGSNDLVPYWIFEREDGASIERRVMLLPLSREEARYQRLRRSLALYRMVFAQPRQEDLLACLENTIAPDQTDAIAARWRICLAPLPAAASADDGADQQDRTASAAQQHVPLITPFDA